MKALAFDGIARDLGTVSTRRGLFRLVGGVAALGGSVALASELAAKGNGHGNGHGNAHHESHGKGHGKAQATGHGKGHDAGKAKTQAKGHGDVSAQKKKGTITICYQNQTR